MTQQFKGIDNVDLATIMTAITLCILIIGFGIASYLKFGTGGA